MNFYCLYIFDQIYFFIVGSFLKHSIIKQLCHQQSNLMNDFNIDVAFLQALDPPSYFPPHQEDLILQIQEKFAIQCERFILNERSFYKCSKFVQNRLRNIIKNSQNIEVKLTTQKSTLEKINHELVKNMEQGKILKQKQQFLSMLCELVRMQSLRKQLLLLEQKDSQKQIGQINNYEIVDEEKYLNNMQKLCNIIKQSQSLLHLKNQFPLINQIMVELQSIYHEAVNKITKKLLTPKMVTLILNRYYHIFTKDQKIKDLFEKAILNNRLQHIRLSLNPMVNNLNYANNMHELYHHILQTWSHIIDQQFELFSKCERYDIIKQTTLIMMEDIISKMEKNIYRIKELVQIVKIRRSIYDFSLQLKNKSQSVISSEKREFDIINSVLGKCDVIIESKLVQESQLLENTKYNIYSLVSYVLIRDHLQKIKICYASRIQKEQIDWELGFYQLSTSRDPKNYPNNKSLIIFNLNIWYLYLKILIGGKHEAEGIETMKWCTDMFISINVQETKKIYYDSFDKMLELGGNIIAFKNVLFAEIQLLGHEDLRRQIMNGIIKKYLDSYQKTLKSIEIQPMSNESVKQFCLTKKINLNKFGKYSNSIRILSVDQLKQILQQD